MVTLKPLCTFTAKVEPSHAKAAGVCSLTSAQDEPPDVFVYDPEVPVLAPGGPLALSGMFDQNALESGNNLLVYTSQPLTEYLHVFGAPRIVAYVSTSASCADLTAKLIRVTEQSAEFCCIGIARSTFLFGDQYQAETAFSAGSLTWSRLRTFSHQAIAFVWRSPQAPSPLYDRNPSTGVKPSKMSPRNWQRFHPHGVSRCQPPILLLSPGGVMTVPEIHFSAVGKRFSSASSPVLEGIDLSIDKGEFVSIIGRSGLRQVDAAQTRSGLVALFARRNRGQWHDPPPMPARSCRLSFRMQRFFPGERSRKMSGWR